MYDSFTSDSSRYIKSGCCWIKRCGFSIRVVEREQGVQIVLGPVKGLKLAEFSALTELELGSVDEVRR